MEAVIGTHQRGAAPGPPEPPAAAASGGTHGVGNGGLGAERGGHGFEGMV